jgi:hypothetical protein
MPLTRRNLAGPDLAPVNPPGITYRLSSFTEVE